MKLPRRRYLLRVKADLASATLQSLKPDVVAAFGLTISPSEVLLCHENSEIINTAYAALAPADITAAQDTPLAELGLKRGSFIFAAWPESKASGRPATSPRVVSQIADSESKAEVDPKAFGLRPAAPVTGAACVCLYSDSLLAAYNQPSHCRSFDAVAEVLTHRGVLLVHIHLPSGRRLLDHEVSAKVTTGQLASL